MGSSFSERHGPRRHDPRPLSGTGPEASDDVFAPASRLAVLGTDLAERPLGPSPAFRAALRAQLLAQAAAPTDVVPPPRAPHHDPAPASRPANPTSSSRREQRRLAHRVTAAGLVLVFGGGGIAAAAADAPGSGDAPTSDQPPVESVRGPAANGTSPSGEVQVVSRRLAEAERLAAPTGAAAGAASAEPADPTARWREFDTVVADAGSALERLQAARPDAQVAGTVAALRAGWQRLLLVVPADQQPSIARVLGLIDVITAALPQSPTALGTTASTAGTAGRTARSVPADVVRPRGGEGPAAATTGGEVARSHAATDPGTSPARQVPSSTGRTSDRSGGAGSSEAAAPRTGFPALPGRDVLPGRSTPTGTSAGAGDATVLGRTSETLTKLLPQLGNR